MDCSSGTFDPVARIGNLCYSYFTTHFIMKLSISKDGLVNGKENWTDDLSTQQCVRTAVYSVLEELDIKVEEEWEREEDSIEITI